MRGRRPFFRKAPSLALLPGKAASRGDAGGKGRFSRVYLKSQNEEENKNKDKIIRVEESERYENMPLQTDR